MPEVAQAGDGVLLRIREDNLGILAGAAIVAEDAVDLDGVESGRFQRDGTVVEQIFIFERELCLVEAAQLVELVVCNRIGTALGLGEIGEQDGRQPSSRRGA